MREYWITALGFVFFVATLVLIWGAVTRSIGVDGCLIVGSVMLTSGWSALHLDARGKE